MYCEGFNTMRPDFSVLRIHELTAAQVRSSGWVMLPLGIFITLASAALLAVVLGVPIPPFLIPDSVRLDQTARESAPIGLVLFLGTLAAFGIVAMIDGALRAVSGKRDMRRLRAMLFIVALLYVAGAIGYVYLTAVERMV